mgnify:CR=1 FL=1
MARKKRATGLGDDTPKLDISSMIDATFLLLIYFLVTTTILPREQDIQMALPAAAPSEKPPEIEPKLISIEANGAIFIGADSNRIPMDSDPNVRELPQLLEDLRSYASIARSADTTPLVQIYVDGGASQQRVIDVLNALTAVEINKVTFTDLTND